jgi:hypothetical protein
VVTDRAFDSVLAPVWEDWDKEKSEVCSGPHKMIIDGIRTAKTNLRYPSLTKICASLPAESDEDERHFPYLKSPRSGLN